MPKIIQIRQRLTEIGQLLYQKGMLAGTDGNFSAKLDEDRLLITCSGVPKGRLSESDFVVINMQGEVIEGTGRPSSEMDMHLTFYNNRNDINACVHSHPPFATGFAVTGIELERNILPEVVMSVGRIPLVEFASPGTGAISKAIKPYLEDNNAFLLRNHGLVTIGNSIEEAFHRHETVEHFAVILYRARQLGNVNTIPDEELTRLDQLRESRSSNKPKED